jgi:nicotinic acid phosphoribosyltransferase
MAERPHTLSQVARNWFQQSQDVLSTWAVRQDSGTQETIFQLMVERLREFGMDAEIQQYRMANIRQALVDDLTSVRLPFTSTWAVRQDSGMQETIFQEIQQYRMANIRQALVNDLTSVRLPFTVPARRLEALVMSWTPAQVEPPGLTPDG